ncbi:MAG: helix-turn-helix transcriptional regulator, partial [Planctomycetota bacterium]
KPCRLQVADRASHDCCAAADDLKDVVESLRSELANLRETSPRGPVDTHALLSPPEVASMLGVSTRTLRRLRHQRRFPRPFRGVCVRPRWRFKDILAYLEGGK